MNKDELKQRYGEEYPAAVVVKGIRLPLKSERRFSRSYSTQDDKVGTEVSRFMDGSAAITAAELEREWPSWTEAERLDFCYACDWLDMQADFPDMLRFIMQHGNRDDWNGIALSVGTHLPSDEAFGVLSKALEEIGAAGATNIVQAIAVTKHPEAEATLRRQLGAIWKHAGLWNDADFINSRAFDATMCITHLIELGAPPADFEAQVRQLSNHVCADNRRSCRSFLRKYYPWLK